MPRTVPTIPEMCPQFTKYHRTESAILPTTRFPNPILLWATLSKMGWRLRLLLCGLLTLLSTSYFSLLDPAHSSQMQQINNCQQTSLSARTWPANREIQKSPGKELLPGEVASWVTWSGSLIFRLPDDQPTSLALYFKLRHCPLWTEKGDSVSILEQPSVVWRLMSSLHAPLSSELMESFPWRAVFQNLSSFTLSLLAPLQSLHNILHLWAPSLNSVL